MIQFDITELMKTLNNTVAYTEGYLSEIQRRRQTWNGVLGQHIVKLLEEYIDALASTSPETLHHVYEWGGVGDPGARLFRLSSRATHDSIFITGDFLASSSTSPTGTEPFVDKATVMESGISVTITPKNGEVLVFEDDGETVFTPGPVYVEHPGGEEVAGSFKSAIEGFLNGYVSAQILRPLLNDMSLSKEWKQLFKSGTKAGYRAGQRAAAKYMRASKIDAV